MWMTTGSHREVTAWPSLGAHSLPGTRWTRSASALWPPPTYYLPCPTSRAWLILCHLLLCLPAPGNPTVFPLLCILIISCLCLLGLLFPKVLRPPSVLGVSKPLGRACGWASRSGKPTVGLAPAKIIVDLLVEGQVVGMVVMTPRIVTWCSCSKWFLSVRWAARGVSLAHPDHPPFSLLDSIYEVRQAAL